MSRAILCAAAGAACLAAAFSPSSLNAAALADVGLGVPLSGPIIIETRWLHPAESSGPAIIGVSPEPGCCHPDDVYAIRYGLTLGDPHSHASGPIRR
ncbi:MAG TPA: hypothetical protein VKX28_17720 [Xanthobacteraceae bacterium]|nr:hypothetical protein [Xanthobacteraceae bacterium]